MNTPRRSPLPSQLRRKGICSARWCCLLWTQACRGMTKKPAGLQGLCLVLALLFLALFVADRSRWPRTAIAESSVRLRCLRRNLSGGFGRLGSLASLDLTCGLTRGRGMCLTGQAGEFEIQETRRGCRVKLHSTCPGNQMLLYFSIVTGLNGACSTSASCRWAVLPAFAFEVSVELSILLFPTASCVSTDESPGSSSPGIPLC